MPAIAPSGTVELEIPGLGKVKGFEFPNGVRHFSSIPYGRLSKRWTRATLATSWENNYHDGTKLGSEPPNPPDFNLDAFVYQVDRFAHFYGKTEIDELTCLNINITIPPNSAQSPFPVFVYIHGGSFLIGGATHSFFDGVNFVSRSVEIGKPVIHVNFTYRTGLGGFLASKDIQKDLEKDGFSGVGNFGLTDQTLAFDWIQQYITSFGGNKDHVTATGESAGAISIGHHFVAARPPVYHRASCMSGLGPTMPTWSLDRHEKLYQAVLRHFKISPTDTDALDKLRAQSQHDLSVSTTFVNGVFAGTGNPCDDGWYHSEVPSMASFKTPPSWVKSFMAGDCLHEGMIFRWNIIDDDYDYFFNKLGEFIGKDKAGKILELYGIFSSTDPHEARLLIEELLGDVYFKIPNWLTLQASKLPESYGYHFDEISELTGPLKGTAHHCHDLLYLFMNKQEALTPEKQKLAQKMADAWITFANGEEPWTKFGSDHIWMTFGPNGVAQTKTDEEDEQVRRYKRFQAVLGLDCWLPLAEVVDEIACKRSLMGKN